MFEPGRVLGDKYRVERVLGRGGMGVVLAATHIHLGTPVALKFVHERGLENQKLLERFLREARAAAILKSEHVCRVFDVGVLDGLPCLVMEQLEGVDLGKVLRRQGRFDTTEAVDYLMQACAGVAEAHAAKIVHRDLKPGNLFLTTRSDGSPLVKVLDFGVAKALEGNTELTQSDAILGSPSYMSLEQLRSSKLVDARSDIWSLGVILFEMVSGKRPFVGEGVADLALKIAMDPIPPMNPPHPLEPIIRKCLEKDPNQRFQDVAELAAALAPYASDRMRGIATSIARIVRGNRVAGPMTGPMTTPIPVPDTSVMSVPDATFSPATATPQPSMPYAMHAHAHSAPGTGPIPEPTTMRSSSGVIDVAPSKGPSRVMIASFLGMIVVGVIVIAIVASSGEPPAKAAAPTRGEVELPVGAPEPPPVDAALAAEPPADAASDPVIATPTPAPGSPTADSPTPKPAPKPKKPKPTPTPKPKAKDVGESRI